MEKSQNKTVEIDVTVEAPVEKAWEYFVTPEHITKWNHASDDWHTPHAENDVRVGGKFLSRMEAKDGSFGFDFSGVYDEVKVNELLSYSMEDGRSVRISFIPQGQLTKVTETFDVEDEHSVEMQREGWQAILDNFKKYTEQN